MRAAVVAVIAWLVSLPLTALYLRGTPFSTVFEAATWRALPTDEIVFTGAVVVALCAAVILLPRGTDGSMRAVLAATAALVALSPLPLSGHSRVAEPVDLFIIVDALHLAAGATWLGGLVGLALTIPLLRGRSDASALVVSRFSTSAAAILTALVVTGGLLAWRIVGSWGAVLTSGYGRLLLVKMTLVGVAVAIAGYNRYGLVPRIRASVRSDEARAAARALVRTVACEVTALVAVLLVTAFLVQQRPPGERAAAPVSQASAGAEPADEPFASHSRNAVSSWWT